MKKLFILLICLGPQLIYAQTPSWSWVKKGSTSSFGAYNLDVATDMLNNAISVGYFYYDITFGNTTLVNQQGTDVYLAKHNSDGKLQWVKQFFITGGTVASEKVQDDGAGNIFVSGSYNGTLTIDGTSITSEDTYYFDGYLAKFNKNGTLLWLITLAGNYENFVFSVATDFSGNAFITGYFRGDMSVGSYTLNGTTLIGLFSSFIAKVDDGGDVLWAVQSVEGAFGSNAMTFNIASNSNGDAVIQGQFYGTIMYGSKSLSASSLTGYLAKFGPNGICKWMKTTGDVNNEFYPNTARGLAIDGAGNIYQSGNFINSLTKGSQTVYSAGYIDAYVAKFSPSGNVKWLRSGGGSGADVANAIVADAEGNCWITGHVSTGTSSFGALSIYTTGTTDAFVLKYNGLGIEQWIIRAGGTSSNAQAIGVGIDRTSKGDLINSGNAYEKINFGSIILNKNPLNKVYIAKIAEPFVRLESELLSAIPLLNDFEIYPNPANNLLSIDLSEEQSLPESVIISDLTGRIFLYHSYDRSSFQSINISGLRAGIYHITLKFRSGSITKTFIKE